MPINISKPELQIFEKTINQIRNWFEKIGNPVKITSGGTGLTEKPFTLDLLVGEPNNTYKLKTLVGGNGIDVINNANNVTIARSGINFVRSVYSGGNINIGIVNDGVFVAVDAINAILNVAVTEPGLFYVSFTFTIQARSLGTTSTLDAETAFRLIDGAGVIRGEITHGLRASTAALIITANGFEYRHSLNCMGVYNFPTIGTHTVTLQKRNLLSVDLLSRFLMSSGAGGGAYILDMSAYRIGS